MQRRSILAALAAGPALTTPAWPQAYPSKPVTFVVPFAAGGSLDALTRMIGDGLARELGQPVVMDFRPGQGGYVGADALARAPADGHTVGMIASTHAIGRSVYPKVPVEINALVPIGLFLRSPFVLVAHPSLDARTVPELAQLAKAQPGKLTIASSGNGSSAHMLAEMLKRSAGIDILHVPYKVGSAATTDVMAGHVQLYFELASAAVQNTKAGRVRALAVTGSQRLSAIPDVPTMREADHPSVELLGWGGLSAPAGTPPAVVARLTDALKTVVSSADTKARFAALNSEAVYSDPTAFGSYVRSESDRLGAIAREANVRIE